MLYQQGDVLIETVEEIPDETLLRRDQVLYYGEASGHAHRLTGDASIRYLKNRDGLNIEDELYIYAPEPTEVVHEEHRAIKLPAGRYRVRKVREWDHFSRNRRYVTD